MAARATTQRPARPSHRHRPSSAGARPSARSRPARPPAPRARRAAGPPTRIRWDLVGRRALLAVLGVILLLYISPVSQWVRQSRTADQAKAELHALERENARLGARARELARPDAVEREARRLGMVRSGERAYVVDGLPAR